MKLKVIIILTLGLLSCNNSANKKPVDNETAKDSLAHFDTFYLDENEVNNNEYKEFHQCDFNKFLNNPKTPQLAKDIYLGKEWDLSNDTEVLSLLDSLKAKDKTSRPFYFKVITLSKKKSDGYYSEGLGHTGYNYVVHNTQEFVSYFENKQCHTDNDLATWADIVILEFSIRRNGSYDKPIVDDYINKLKSNCKDCSTAQKEIINKFGFTLKAKWNGFLEQLED